MKERPILFNAEMVRAILEGRKTQTRRVAKCFPDWHHYGKKILDWGLSYHPHQHFDAICGRRPNLKDGDWTYDIQTDVDDSKCVVVKCPFGKIGDRLWVRETWAGVNLYGEIALAYKADGEVTRVVENESFQDEDGLINYDDPRLEKYSFAAWADDLLDGKEGNWKPSIHMPRWASRITLEITNIRVERLNDISEADAIDEGIKSRVTAVPPYDSIYQIPDNPSYYYTAKQAFSQLWESINGEDSWDKNPWVWVVEFKVVGGNAL